MKPIVTEINIELKVPIRLWEFSLEHLGKDVQDNIHDAILDIVKQGHCHRDPEKTRADRTSTMSQWCMHKEYPVFKKISDRAESVIQEWFMMNAKMTLLTNLTACWYASYDFGQQTVPHEHSPDLFAFSYYVQVDENTTPLVFPGHPGYSYQPRQGYGVIFPGWLTHQVLPHNSVLPRVVVAGNIEGTALQE
jgi:hypothetical protein